MAELMGSLDVKERAREKDTRGKGTESSSTNMVQKKNFNASRNKKKNKQENNLKPKQTTTFKKKRTTKMVVALLAGVMSIGQVRA
jgi:hypothetical protein